jgi:RimJ/RimL family protein N-acetyltransferase
MTELRPGQILREFTTKSNRTALLRILKENDAKDLQDYINRLSSEDTYVAFSGENVTLKEEQATIKSYLNSLKNGNCIPIICKIDGKIVSICRINRKLNMKKRSLHIAVVVISVRKEFRGEGIGKECLDEVITQSRNLKGVSILKLTAFADNEPAIKLYEKAGFIEVARLPKQYFYKGKYQDNIIMQKELEN